MKILIIREPTYILYQIGIVWLKIIDLLIQENLLNDFKQDMSKQITIIGEYVGFNSLLKYPRTSIIFHSIVENNSNFICLPTPDSYEFFYKYKLQFSPVEKISKPIFNFASLAMILKEIYTSVSTSHICDEEEGSV